ncbi:hypothetical protein ACEPAI_435 [Sanghuangporus weigelae]
MPSINVPEGYSYVFAVATATAFLNSYQMVNTAQARKAAGVPYPYAYVEKAEAASNSAAQKFNCAQRAHQNTLEHTPYVLYSLLVSGLKYPYLSVALGTSWVVGRFLYTLGYSSGDPRKRNQPGGLLSFMGQFGLYLASAFTTYKFIAEGL